MVCKLLISGTAPTTVPTNIQTIYETLYNEQPEELPLVNFGRGCRVVVKVMCETMVAIKIASSPEWGQLWTDPTTRHQIPFTALIVGLLGKDGNLDPVVKPSCIFMEDERS
jgi:hypothetical protein